MNRNELKDGIKLGLTMVNTIGVGVIVGKTVNTVMEVASNNNPMVKLAVTTVTMGLGMIAVRPVNEKCNEVVDKLFEEKGE